MSERKVLNKYYPPDFDPSKIPKLRLPRNRQYSIRIMAPFNMRCDTCGEYIYKGKKFNSRKETVENEDYLGLKIFRFYIKCPCCVSEIAFKTDLKNTDYTLEAGAKRNFEAAKLAEEMEERSRKEKEEEELNNPMKVLENRTKASRQEMEQIDALEELKDLNMRHATVDHETMLKRHAAQEEILMKLQDEEDEKLIESIFNKQRNKVKRLDSDDVDPDPPVKKSKRNNTTDILTLEYNLNSSLSNSSSETVGEKPAWERSVGLLSSKNCLTMLCLTAFSHEVTHYLLAIVTFLPSHWGSPCLCLHTCTVHTNLPQLGLSQSAASWVNPQFLGQTYVHFYYTQTTPTCSWGGDVPTIPQRPTLPIGDLSFLIFYVHCSNAMGPLFLTPQYFHLPLPTSSI
ncbi:Splicing factor YJU2 [Acanthosepion pharaonis]|uniref:Splicing factor YJU2 n=1 Tax=Acanthosepion pharaonis TaxID=158019 RepID=A0A812AT39_ACAPH|nr:Splicing factor YJU2 [Sepia pharaonis]